MTSTHLYYMFDTYKFDTMFNAPEFETNHYFISSTPVNKFLKSNRQYHNFDNCLNFYMCRAIVVEHMTVDSVSVELYKCAPK